MAGKLGLTNEVKEMKLGKSFGKGEHPCFHTFRYDFMPASLDTTKRASVDIGDGHQVTVTVPHIEGSGTDNTVFKGSKKPYQKECVLIIDHATGEITLEKLSYNVQLKKTRAEGSSKIRSNTPIENTFNSKKSPQSSSHRLSPQQKSHSAFGRSSPIQKSSPLPKSPVSNLPSPNGSSNHSMPCLTTLTKPPVIPETPAVHAPHEDIHGSEIGLLSSSSSSASSSSEDSSDSSASDNEEMVEVPHKSQDVSNGFNESPRRKEVPSAQTSSNHLSMPTSNNLSMPTSNNFSMPTSNNFSMPTSNNLSMPTANSLPSMPKFNLLNEDLKLSESDSEDSDD